MGGPEYAERRRRVTGNTETVDGYTILVDPTLAVDPGDCCQ